MGLYLLDTNIVIDIYSHRHSQTLINKIVNEPQSRLGVSIITVAEFFAGGSKDDHRRLKQWLGSGELAVHLLDDTAIAISAGELRQKENLPFAGALILAHAVSLKACLVSNDIDFCRKAKRHVKTMSP